MSKVYDMKNAAARSGRILGEDGKVYNIVDLLKNAGNAMNKEEFYTKEEVNELLQTVEDLRAEVERLKSQIQQN